MQRDIETALRNAKHIEVPDSTFKRVENVLRSLEERKDITGMKPKYRKQTLVAVIAVISLVALSTAALAYTGVLSGVFSAITGGRDIEGEFGSDTRKAIVEHDHVVEVEPHTFIAEDGSKLELNAYFADSREIWFDFTLSDADIPDNWDYVQPCYFSLEMTQSDGTVSKWEHIIDEDLSERATFPGGHSFIDRTNNTHGGESIDGSHRFVHNVSSSPADDGSLNITIIVSFSYPYPQIGEKIHLQIGNFMFTTTEFPDDIILGADETLEMYYDSWIVNRTILKGVWEYEIDVDSRFTDVSQLIYDVVNGDEAAQHGIIIHSITVTPTAGRVEVTIDTSKSSIMNPNYVVIRNPINMFTEDGNPYILENPTPQQILDYGFMHLNVYAEANGNRYTANGSTIDMNGDILKGWFEFGSMYFDAPESLTLVFETHVFNGELTEAPIRIPLKLVG